MSAPEFTEEQRAYLRDLLRPRCCHVTGEHDPRHFVEGRYVCEIQASEAWNRACQELFGEQFGPEDALPKEDCGWCESRAQRPAYSLGDDHG